jgi:hypothetical protein
VRLEQPSKCEWIGIEHTKGHRYVQPHGGHRTARGEEHRSLDETKQSRQDSFPVQYNTVVEKPQIPVITVIIMHMRVAANSPRDVYLVR